MLLGHMLGKINYQVPLSLINILYNHIHRSSKNIKRYSVNIYFLKIEKNHLEAVFKIIKHEIVEHQYFYFFEQPLPLGKLP